MQYLLSADEMADEKTSRQIEAIKKDAKRIDDRLEKVETSSGRLKDYVQTDIGNRLSKTEGRAEMLTWLVGIAVPLYVVLFIAGGTQLYLLNGRVSGIESDVHHISASVDAIRLKQIVSNPTDQQSFSEIKRVVNDAKAKKIQIPKQVITETGQKLVGAANSNPDAWDAALSLLDYRSFLDSVSFSEPPGRKSPPQGIAVHNNYESSSILNRGEAQFSTIGVVRPPDEAEFHYISGPYANENAAYGPSYIIFDNATVLLDGMKAKNVIFRNSHIIYRGGPLELDQVYFINCTFEVNRDANGQKFALAVLADTPQKTFDA